MLNVLFLVLGVGYSVDVSNAQMLKWSDDLLRVPVVVSVGRFSDETAEQFSKDMQAAVASKEPVIPVLIDSYGGSVYALLRMIDVMKSSPVPVATICLGKCMSAGAMLLGMGTEGYRFAGPNATILLHDASTTIEGKVDDIKNETIQIEKLNKLIFKLVAKNCGKPDSYFLDILDSKGHIDWFLSAEEASFHNLINHIKVPSIKIKVKTEMTLE